MPDERDKIEQMIRIIASDLLNKSIVNWTFEIWSHDAADNIHFHNYIKRLLKYHL